MQQFRKSEMVDGSAQLEARDQRAYWLAVTPPDYDDSQYELGSDWPEDITTDEWALYHGAGSRLSPVRVIYQDEMFIMRRPLEFIFATVDSDVEVISTDDENDNDDDSFSGSEVLQWILLNNE